MISATVLCDSVSPAGSRLLTFGVVCHRYILAEINTHRVLSRNYRSSRAVPVVRMLREVETNPAKPLRWLSNRPGMQGGEPLSEVAALHCDLAWQRAAQLACRQALELENLGAHKQFVNRLLEPFLWVHGVVTGTEWDNFYELRRHPDAQPEFRALADAMWEAQAASTPVELQPGEWHIPYLAERRHAPYVVTRPAETMKMLKVSAARCARVSYVGHDEKPTTIDQDIELADNLLVSRHMSPFEHQAAPAETDQSGLNGNLSPGWVQYRKLVERQRDRVVG